MSIGINAHSLVFLIVNFDLEERGLEKLYFEFRVRIRKAPC